MHYTLKLAQKVHQVVSICIVESLLHSLIPFFSYSKTIDISLSQFLHLSTKIHKRSKGFFFCFFLTQSLVFQYLQFVHHCIFKQLNMRYDNDFNRNSEKLKKKWTLKVLFQQIYWFIRFVWLSIISIITNLDQHTLLATLLAHYF